MLQISSDRVGSSNHSQFKLHCVEDLALNVKKTGVNIENLILNRLAAKNEGIFSEV